MTQPELQVGWQDYLALALRRKRFFLIPLVAVLILGGLFALCSPRIYEARALIAVQNEKLINPLIQGLAMPTQISDRLKTLREEILSWSNLTRLISAHELDREVKNPVAFERLVNRLRDDIRVRMKGQTLIEVSYEGREPAKVHELVNSLTDIVIERDAAIQRQESDTAVSFIETELTVYRKKLEESEQRLREFKELYMTQMPVVTALNKQLKDLEVELSSLLITSTEQHPRVIETRRMMEEVKRQRDEEIRRLVAKGVLDDKDPELVNQLMARSGAGAGASTDPAVRKAQEAYTALVEGLESPEVTPTALPPAALGTGAAPAGTNAVSVNDAAAASLTLAPRQQQELVRLTRDYTVNESIYRGLLEKLERAKITGRLGEDAEGGKFVIIERARFPLKPVKPNLMQVLLLSLVLGVGLGGAAVILAEYLDQSVQTAEEVAELLAVPALGAICTIMTEGDLRARTKRRKSWFSMRDHSHRFKTYVAHPIWSRIDQALLRWGL